MEKAKLAHPPAASFGDVGEARVVALQARSRDAAVPDAWLPPSDQPSSRRTVSAEPRESLWPRLLFLIIVIVPTVAIALYMAAIATDQYISEAHFVVRSAQRQNVGGLTAILQSSGLSGMTDESGPVRDFIMSRDAVAEINKSVGFRDMVGREDADGLAKFPNFYQQDTFEELFEHYSWVVSVVHDASTGINTLKVRTFSADDSKRVTEALLRASEQLVNRMNERALGDAVALASREVKIAEDRSATAQRLLNAYRNSVGLVDTGSTARSYLELIGVLERELSQSRAQLASMLASAPNNPAVQSMRDRIAALEQQVASDRAKLVGTDISAVSTFGEFSRLTLEAEFAGKALTAANTMLEGARMEALRKQLYLERVVEPNAADKSRYPRRIISVLAVFGTAFLLYAIIWLVVANAREHAS